MTAEDQFDLINTATTQLNETDLDEAEKAEVLAVVTEITKTDKLLKDHESRAV